MVRSGVRKSSYERYKCRKTGRLEIKDVLAMKAKLENFFDNRVYFRYLYGE